MSHQSTRALVFVLAYAVPNNQRSALDSWPELYLYTDTVERFSSRGHHD